MNIIQQYEAAEIARLTADRAVPEFAPGDTVRVSVKVVEGERSRVQAYEGVCIARSNRGLNSNFTVRKISYGEGVERVFPLYAPTIAEITVIRRGDVRLPRRCAGRDPLRRGGASQRRGPHRGPGSGRTDQAGRHDPEQRPVPAGPDP